MAGNVGRPPTLPPGFTARPCRVEDAAIVAEMIADCEEFEDGLREMTAEDIRAFWSVPDLDLPSSTLVVFHGERLAANAEVGRGYASVDIHPDFRGRGLGTALLPWTWERARTQGSAKVGQSVSDRRTDAPALFERHGYERAYANWLLRMPIADVREPRLPEGYTLRDLDLQRNAREAFEVIDRAFGEWDDDRDPWESWIGFFGAHERLATWASPLAIHEGRVVGAAIAFDYGPGLDAWIQQLAVERSHRGKGLGAALIHASFARFAARGYPTGGLGTDSRGSALAFYERVGFSVRTSATYWSKDLTAT